MQEAKGSNSRNNDTTSTVTPLSSRTQVLKSSETVLSRCLHICAENYAGFSIVFNQVKLHHMFVWSLKCSIANLVNKIHLKGFHQTQQISSKVEADNICKKTSERWDAQDRQPEHSLLWELFPHHVLFLRSYLPAFTSVTMSNLAYIRQSFLRVLRCVCKCRGGDRRAEARNGCCYPTAGRHSLWI